MIIKHNYDDLKKQCEGMSPFQKHLFLEELKEKDKDSKEMEEVLNRGALQRIRKNGVKKWGWSNNDVLN